MGAPGSERAIVSITRWAQRAEWRERLDLIIEAHFGRILGELELPADQLPEVLGEAFPALFGCVLEDFLTCDFGADGRSIVTDYLKRRGFRERAPVKSYLRALQVSVMSAYEVVTTVPGSHFVLRDLIRGGAPIRVEDRLGSQSVKPADCIAARLLPINGRTFISAGVLYLPAAQARTLARKIRRLGQRFRGQVARAVEAEGRTLADVEAVIPLADVLLGELAPVFTQVWLTATLEEVLDVVLGDSRVLDGLGEALAGQPAAEAEAEARLAQALPELGGRSPRQAARSRQGRRQVAQWLKYQQALERGEEAAAPPDLGWMWQALGIEHLR